MKIIHLTDFHFKGDKHSISSQAEVIDKLCEQVKGMEIDLLLFTGDLVYNGSKKENFFKAKEALFDKISSSIKIEKSNILLCCGNHDVNRNQELEAINTELNKINDNPELNKFIKSQDGRQFKESTRNIDNYFNFQKEYYNLNSLEGDTIESLFTIHKRSIDQKKIGIASINTAWRSMDSEKDRGNLLFPTSFIEQIISELKSTTEFRILLHHHPLSDLKYWNSSIIEDAVYNGFHMMMSGHVHKRSSSAHINYDEGIFECVSPAVLSLNDSSSKFGFSILDIDTESFSIDINNYFYDSQDRVFLSPNEPIKAEIPLYGDKRNQNEFRKTIRKRLEEETVIANDLFISSNETVTSKLFLDLFTEPIIKSKSRAQIAGEKKDGAILKLSDINEASGSFLIYGKDKSGKTSLLYKIKLELLKSFSLNKTIPYYFDCREYRKSQKELNLERLFTQYFEVSKAKLHSLMEKYHFKLLIDNYDPAHESTVVKINSFLKQHPNVGFIAVSEEKLMHQSMQLDFNNSNFQTLYIHEISRNEIRKLTDKWPNIQSERKELILDKITKIFIQLNIPMNYWTVSLFLWIFEKTNDANFHNNFELIQLYIDNLLDRNSLVLDNGLKLDFEQFKSYLGALSYFLIQKHDKSYYSASYSDLVGFTENYRLENKRFVIPVEDIINMVLNKGILKKAYDGNYTFRLNGVFEYFLAYHMNENESFRDNALNDPHYYLSFSNEFEIYSGFNKKDKSFVESIHTKTQEIFLSITNKYSAIGNSDQILLDKVSSVFDISVPLKKITERTNPSLSPEKQDALIEEFAPTEVANTEVTLKKFYDAIDPTFDNLEKALFVLSRVYRNCSVSDDHFNNEILDFILDSSCNLGFELIEEQHNSQDANKFSYESEKVMMQLMTNFMPLIVQTFLYDAIAQNNLQRVFEDKIEELKLDAANNQFKLLILYFLLVDMDLKAHKNYIDEIIENNKHGILKQTTIIKLYTYLMFKTHNQPELEKFLQERIKIQQVKIDSSVDFSLFQGAIRKQKIKEDYKKRMKKGRS